MATFLNDTDLQILKKANNEQSCALIGNEDSEESVNLKLKTQEEVDSVKKLIEAGSLKGLMDASHQAPCVCSVKITERGKSFIAFVN